MKSKRGKAIIGIAMAAIMVASVMVAMMPMGMSRPTATQIDSGDTIYIGEQGLAFDADQDGDYGDALTPDVTATLEAVDEDIADTLSLSATYTVPSVTEGKYFFDANGDGALTLPGEFYLFVKKAEITGDILLNNAAQDSIVGKSVPTSAEIVFKADLNYGGGKIPLAEFKIVVTDPDGVVIEEIDDQDLRNLDATLGTTLYIGDSPVPAAPAPKGVTITAPDYIDAIDLAGLDTGTYKVQIKTEKTPCNMLNIASPEMEFTIRSEEVAIEAVEDTISVGDDMLLKVNGNPKEWYYLTVTDVDVTKAPVIRGDTGDVKALDAAGDAYPVTLTPNLAAWIQTGSDGIADVKITTTNADDRTYTINVYEVPDPTGVVGFLHPAAGLAAATFVPDTLAGALNDVNDVAINDDDVDVKVREPTVTFDIPASVIVGEEVLIRGTISAGDTVDILIDDGKVADFWDDEPVDENNEFEVKWDTTGLTTGSYPIDVYIDCAPTAATATLLDAAIQAWVPAIDEDGKTTIRLVMPTLTAKQPRNVVAEDDKYLVEGTAMGVDDVDIVLIGPDGCRPGFAAYAVGNGLDIISSSVTDGEFSEDPEMPDDVDTGMWKVLVLSAGRDGEYGDATGLAAGNLDGIAGGAAIFEGKNQDQIVSMIREDYTVDATGSDDLLVEFAFKVESGDVDLNPIEFVAIGEPLEVSGVTNREPGTIIMISTFVGPTDLPAVMATVEWSTADEGVFNATIDTTDAVLGTYTIIADDGDGNTDTADVEIVTAVPTATPTAEPTATPTATPTIEPVPTVEPTEEPTPTPEPPGFEAVFAIAGLLSIAYLVLRKRRE